MGKEKGGNLKRKNVRSITAEDYSLSAREIHDQQLLMK